MPETTVQLGASLAGKESSPVTSTGSSANRGRASSGFRSGGFGISEEFVDSDLIEVSIDLRSFQRGLLPTHAESIELGFRQTPLYAFS